MRHAKAFKKLSRTPSHRRALMRNLATSLFKHEQLETTVAKAKSLRGVAEKLITLAKDDNLAARRKAFAYLQSKEVVHKLFAEIGPKFKERPGGYTRTVRTRHRLGDAAEMAVIALVAEEMKTAKKKPARKAKKVAEPVAAEQQE